MTDSSSLRIRDAGEHDLDALIDLLEQLFSIETDFQIDPPKQRHGLLRLLEPTRGAKLLVAELDGRVVGMVTAQLLISTAEGGPVGFVEDVVVDRSARGRGIGGRMLEVLENWAADKGLSRLQLLADRENISALGFYQRRGWRPTRLVAWQRSIG